MKKIVTVIGARPQFIKAAPVSQAFLKRPVCSEILVHTGQHYDDGLSGIFFNELDIPEPQYNLGVGSGSHAVQTGEIMKRLESVLLDEKPDIILIYGDTNSTLAAALTAAKLHIPVAHVEAGLRSFNRKMPEEINRIVADRLSTLLFAPTSTAVNNLQNEGITEGVYKTGDVMYDVALKYRERAHEQSTILQQLNIQRNGFILATIHRAENTDDPDRLNNIFTALGRVSADIPVVFPMHPRTRKMADGYNLQHLVKTLKVIDPAGFFDMIRLETSAKCIVTDSGGVQKEAYFHKVPCVTVRDETEWVETVEAGWNALADASDSSDIVTNINSMIEYAGQRKEIDEYGNGKSAEAIADTILRFESGKS